jgi:hypothetical protein
MEGKTDKQEPFFFWNSRLLCEGATDYVCCGDQVSKFRMKRKMTPPPWSRGGKGMHRYCALLETKKSIKRSWIDDDVTSLDALSKRLLDHPEEIDIHLGSLQEKEFVELVGLIRSLEPRKGQQVVTLNASEGVIVLPIDCPLVIVRVSASVPRSDRPPDPIVA